MAETFGARTSFAPLWRLTKAFCDTGTAAEDAISNFAPVDTLTPQTFGNAALPVRRTFPRFTVISPDVVLVRFVNVSV